MFVSLQAPGAIVDLHTGISRDIEKWHSRSLNLAPDRPVHWFPGNKSVKIPDKIIQDMK